MPVIRPGLRLRASGKGRSAFAHPSSGEVRLVDLPAPKHNPGNLIGRCYLPDNLKPGAPLVVVLHGCTQNAAVYDLGSGWSRLADRHGFALLYPEQQRANNPMLCFNWFQAEDTRRGMGETASILAMVEQICGLHDLDASRVFVTGLSAGGAMASVVLATHPEVFAGGAIIAGVAYGCANGAAEAFECMSGRGQTSARDLAGLVRRASPHAGPWPRVQVWQGSADRTVDARNADRIIRQWTELHGLAATPSLSDRVAGHPRRQWLDSRGEALIEHYEITGMAHGTPLDPGEEVGQSGQAGAHMLDVGLSSTDRIAAFFGIAPAAREEVAQIRGAAGKVAVPSKTTTARVVPAKAVRNARPPAMPQDAAQAQPGGVHKIIEDALRAAGLMK